MRQQAFSWLIVLFFCSVADAAEEVAIEVPVGTRYIISGPDLLLSEASGETVALASPATFEVCGETLCPPLSEHPLPVKVSAKDPDKLVKTPLSVNGRKLKGTLWITLQKGHLSVVNRLSLEDYLVATVGSEMPRSFPKEALKAQAVAARTFAVARKILRAGEVAEMSSTTLDQVYGGLDHESTETKEAVGETSGQVLVYDREPIEAFFFSSCVGQTREAKVVFGVDKPYLKNVDCAVDNAPSFAWHASLSRSELEDKLGFRFREMKVGPAGQDGRPIDVTFQPGQHAFSPEALRKRLGYHLLKSADFKASCNATTCLFEGRGNGHGVGMCQWGAKNLASAGKSYREILAHYFPGSELKQLY